jgi:glycosyltransferase involved in cell wall biosynthesis
MPTNPIAQRDISVVIPAHNGEQFLREAIESVLTQTLAATEIIVVDDGSSDGTPQIAKAYDSVRYHHQEQSGAAVARNAGAKIASSQWIAFLDADDVWLPNKLERQAAACQADPDLKMAFGQIKEFVSPHLSIAEARQLKPRNETLSGPSNITLLMRRKDFLDTGGFPIDLQLGEFIAWYVQATHSGLKTYTIPEVLALRRLHTTNQGRTNRSHLNQFALIAKRALDHKRQSQTQQQ